MILNRDNGVFSISLCVPHHLISSYVDSIFISMQTEGHEAAMPYLVSMDRWCTAIQKKPSTILMILSIIHECCISPLIVGEPRGHRISMNYLRIFISDFWVLTYVPVCTLFKRRQMDWLKCNSISVSSATTVTADDNQVSMCVLGDNKEIVATQWL